MSKMKRNILLNPGPANTTDTVKNAQIVPDICPREEEFCKLMDFVATQITNIVADTNRYTTVLFGGSGTAAVESILSSVVNDGHIMIVNNGAYGKRMCEIAEAYQLDWVEYQSSPIQPIDLNALKLFINNSPRKISYLAIVHNETTTGLLNDIEMIGMICKEKKINLIVDAMSSFAAIPMNMSKMNISYLAASSNKNLQGMAGISFVIAKTSELEKTPSKKPTNYYLNLHQQYCYFKKTGQMRFTPPVQTLYALKQAILELIVEGVENRYKRYCSLWDVLTSGLSKLGLNYLVPPEHHSKIVTAVLEPNNRLYDFKTMHDFFYQHGITIYPGKLEQFKSFRIANIGDLKKSDVEYFLMVLRNYLQSIE